MATKVKGILRGLRYISQIFDEKEPEMQIGFPTDVKHVAHIGCDGPTANQPSWMNEFKSPAELTSSPVYPVGEMTNLSIHSPSEDRSKNEKSKRRSRHSSSGPASPVGSPGQESTDASPKQSRHRASNNAGSPTSPPRNLDAPRHSRSHRSSIPSVDSPSHDSSGSGRTSRRRSNLGVESPDCDQLSIPKHSRRRKSKELGSASTRRSSRSKDSNSSAETIAFSGCASGDTESVQGRKKTANNLSSVLEAYGEG